MGGCVYFTLFSVCFLFVINSFGHSQDLLGCGGFVKSDISISYSLIEVKLYTQQGSLKYRTECAPNNGYYYIPLYDKGDYVLKVEPPSGWYFEPQSYDLHVDGSMDKCSRGEDINFVFAGFSVLGKVVSKGFEEGPAGVTITLKQKGSTTVLQQSTSALGGSYAFQKVLPGEYTVAALHDKWNFHNKEVNLAVSTSNGDAGNGIIVYGYDVRGIVMSEGEPIRGVHFVLLSDTLKPKDILNCDQSLVPGFPHKEAALCHVTSQADGSFTFPSLPNGAYTLVPFYKGEHITFDVIPAIMDFTVNHDSLVLKKTFLVAGFSVTGKVLYTLEGSGVAGAEVSLDGKSQAITKQDGTYHLDNMKSGTYTLTVTANQIFFNPMKVKVNPNTPHLPDIVVSRFGICGQVKIDFYPESLVQTPQQRQVSVQEKGVAGTRLIDTDTAGRFCVEVAAGSYTLKAISTDLERQEGLHLVPAEQETTVVNQPVMSVTFTQFRASVEGTITCLEKCDHLKISVLAVGKLDDRHIIYVNEAVKGASFAFIDVLPGKYRVAVTEDKWCWKEKAHEISVVDKDLTGVQFVHTGYVFTCSATHAVTLEYSVEDKSNKPHTGSFQLTKGVNKVCLDKPGIYTLKTRGCHTFNQQEYKYNTAKPTVLTLSATHHLVSGFITSPLKINDITISVQSTFDANPVMLQPTLMTDNKGSGYSYQFSYWGRSGERIDVAPSSQTLLFYPPSQHLLVQTDECFEALRFEGKKGVYIEGKILPALSGVTITVTPANDTQLPIVVETNVNGSYKIGPLHGSMEYTTTAEKTGYVLTEMESGSGFNAFKLAEIHVEVVDTAGTHLAGVLLSLSGGASYRSNNVTPADGKMIFSSLTPGQYFLRPMMKEYNFEPSSKMIEVKEGAVVHVPITSSRVAFSCFGAVTSLNGQAEPGLTVEAVGKEDSCKEYQEEAKTEQDGSFRLRGLQPTCNYILRLKFCNTNSHIERTAPKNMDVQVKDSDLTGIHLIAFRKINEMELSGNIVTSQEFIPSLKVQLHREHNIDSALHTTSLGSTSFFYLPSLTIDNQTYLLRLTSSLSRAAYDYNLPEITFTANATYKHFTFQFTPKKKAVEQELHPTSFMVLPLTAIFVLLAYHYQKIVPFLLQASTYVQSVINKPGATYVSSPEPTSPTEEFPNVAKKKNKPRKA